MKLILLSVLILSLIEVTLSCIPPNHFDAKDCGPFCYRGDQSHPKDGRPHYRNYGTMVDWIPQSRAPGAVIGDPPGWKWEDTYGRTTPPPSLDPNQVYGIHGSSQLMTGKDLMQKYGKHKVIYGRK